MPQVLSGYVRCFDRTSLALGSPFQLVSNDLSRGSSYQFVEWSHVKIKYRGFVQVVYRFRLQVISQSGHAIGQSHQFVSVWLIVEAAVEGIDCLDPLGDL